MQIPQHQGDAELYTIHRQSFQAMEAYKKIQRTQAVWMDSYQPLQATKDSILLAETNINFQLLNVIEYFHFGCYWQC